MSNHDDVGKIEFFPNHPIYPINNTPTYKTQPYKCPVCKGNGIVAGGFYIGTGEYRTSTCSTEQCKICNGKGIIWG